jgi:hypothetical protein
VVLAVGGEGEGGLVRGCGEGIFSAPRDGDGGPRTRQADDGIIIPAPVVER